MLLFTRKVFALVWFFAIYMIFGLQVTARDLWHPFYHLSMKNGLPSNNIYELLQDQNGFIWMATDAGVVRYDGNFIQVYTVNEGLPDNDIIQIDIEQNGTIWVNPYNRKPAYFDPVKNRFIQPLIHQHQIIEQIQSQRGWTLNHLYNGGVGYTGINYSIAFHNKKQYAFTLKNYWQISVNDTSSLSIIFPLHQDSRHFKLVGEQHASSLSDTTTLWVFREKKYLNFGVRYKIFDSLFFATIQNGIGTLIWSVNLKNPGSNISQMQVPSPPLNFSYHKNRLILCTAHSGLLIYDFQNQKLLYKNENIPNPKSAILTKEGQLIVGTQSDGVHFLTLPRIQQLEPKFQTQSQLFSAIYKSDDKLIAGTAANECVEIQKQGAKVIREDFGNLNSYIRAIFEVKNKLFVAGDGSSRLNSRYLFRQEGLIPLNFKSAIQQDGFIYGSNHHGIYQINPYNAESKILKVTYLAYPLMAAKNKRQLYLGGPTGLYLFDVYKQELKSCRAKNSLFAERLTAMIFSPDQLMWLSTVGRGIAVFYQDQQVGTVGAKQGLASNQIFCLCNGKAGTIFAGTQSGVSRIRYRFPNSFQVENYSIGHWREKRSALSMTYHKDTLYIGTNDGLFILPDQQEEQPVDIPVYLTRCQIQNHDTIISHKYVLPFKQSNIQLQFAALNLDGKFKQFEYQIDGEGWNPFQSNILNLVLEPGHHLMEVIAKDQNGHSSAKPLQIIWEIQVPFYTTTWFYLVMLFVVLSIIFYFLLRQKIVKNKLDFERQLALSQQRDIITTDLHDDVGATLSSMQVNSHVARKNLEKNQTEKTREILERIEQQAKEVSEKMGDMIWSIQPNADKITAVDERLRMIAHEILGESGIIYHIEIDSQVNDFFHDIGVRKNVTLIVKEALNNILKYSGATSANISLQINHQTMILRIKDHGMGFDKEGKSGNGLRNMKSRAEELKGKFEVISQVGMGTEIVVTIPDITRFRDKP